ncbi:MAG: DegT/DnrJ/EryC1/StrS family aminotransferase [Planctomycetes bacterium]|nr:DegT/DnrJ/EryC1/StrS family aminotransferase [Planctomycetota bacterium]
MGIGVWAYLRELEVERAEILAAVERVLDSGTLILGPEVRAFEEAFAAWCGVPHGVGVASGTDALILGLKALGVGPGDEVLTVANTAVPTVSAIVSAGAAPRFVDVDPRTMLMDAARLEEAITERTRCLLPVHLYGQCVDMEAVRRAAAAHSLACLEDCAQAHGATHRGRRAGSMGDAAAFSFYPTKVLGGFGDGGMVLTPDAGRAERLRRLRFYGMEGDYRAREHGTNSRLDEVHAAILRGRLARVDGYLARRRALALRYDEGLAGLDLGLPVTAEGNGHAHYLYVCRHPSRDRLLAALAERDIHLNTSYRWPIHLMDAYRDLGYRPGDLPETERACDEVFSLPMYPSLSDGEQEGVIRALREVLG